MANFIPKDRDYLKFRNCYVAKKFCSHPTKTLRQRFGVELGWCTNGIRFTNSESQVSCDLYDPSAAPPRYFTGKNLTTWSTYVGNLWWQNCRPCPAHVFNNKCHSGIAAINPCQSMAFVKYINKKSKNNIWTVGVIWTKNPRLCSR